MRIFLCISASLVLDHIGISPRDGITVFLVFSAMIAVAQDLKDLSK